jgi:lysozyme
MTKAQGIDISKWQNDASTPQYCDFDKAYAAGARFVYIKASQGSWADRDFLMNWENAARSRLLVGAYHFIDWSVPIATQARFFAGLLKNWRGHLPPVADYEMRTGAPAPHTARNALAAFLNELEQALGQTPIIYTARGFWAEYGSIEARWVRYPLWLANYTTAPAPIVPLPWTSYTFWQYTDKGPGLQYGAESHAIDLNWYNGTEAQLYAQYAPTYPPPQPVEPEPVKCLRVLSSYLNIRSGPGTGNAIVGTLPKGEHPAVEVTEVRQVGADTWAKVTRPRDEWVALRHGGVELARWE